jgi:Ca-activated chloride channel homolog
MIIDCLKNHVLAVSCGFLLLIQSTAPTPQTQAPPPNSSTAASIGLLVDNSKSMLPSRKAVLPALLKFVEASNPDNEFFVVNFSDSPYLDQDFTTDRGLVEKALQKPIIGRGTAFYDAVGDSSVHLRQGARTKKHILIIVSDGEDNESHVPAEKMVQELQQTSRPVVYCVVPVVPNSRGAKILDKMAKETGGKVYRATNPRELEKAMADLRQQIQQL